MWYTDIGSRQGLGRIVLRYLGSEPGPGILPAGALPGAVMQGIVSCPFRHAFVSEATAEGPLALALASLARVGAALGPEWQLSLRACLCLAYCMLFGQLPFGA